ncbi:MAG: hypothetical protein ACK4NT_06330 [Candidatus Omnitrophota bacterium]
MKIELFEGLVKKEISEEKKEEIARSLLENLKLGEISFGLSKEFKLEENIERLIKNNLEAILFVQALNQKEGNSEILEWKDKLVNDELQVEILKKYGVLVTGEPPFLINETNLSLMGNLLGQLPQAIFKGQFFALILGSSGMILFSSLGMISFLPGTSFTLAEFLKMFMKFIPEKPPLKYPLKNMPEEINYIVYLWQILFIFIFWFLMAEGKIPALLKEIKSYRKTLPKILVRAKDFKERTFTAGIRRKRAHFRRPCRELIDFEDIHKNLQRIKHYAKYLSDLTQK